MMQPDWRHSISACLVVFTLVATVGISTALAEHSTPRYDPVLSPGWERIGGFKGAAGSKLLGRVNDLLFEQEASGTLYRDLGDVSLGLGYSPEGGEIKWDNSFYRRVLPLHREIQPGGVVTGDDLSSYLDIKTLISRGRVRYDFISNIVGDDGRAVSEEQQARLEWPQGGLGTAATGCYSPPLTEP